MVYTPNGLSYQAQPGIGGARVGSGTAVGGNVGALTAVGVGKSGVFVVSTTAVVVDEGARVGVRVTGTVLLQAPNKNSPMKIMKG
jgi:hypothetical protein